MENQGLFCLAKGYMETVWKHEISQKEDSVRVPKNKGPGRHKRMISLKIKRPTC